VTTKKKMTRPAAKKTKAAGKLKTTAPKKIEKPRAKVKAAAAKTARSSPKAVKITKTAKTVKTTKAATPVKTAKAVKTTKAAKTAKVTPPVTAKKNAEDSVKNAAAEAVDKSAGQPVEAKATPAQAAPPKSAKSRATRTTLDDLALDVEEKDRLLEEEKRDLAKALREDEDEPLETAFIPTDTSERIILVVDEDGPRRTETISIVQQILPNAVIELADDPEEALEVMEEAEFDTFVVNFLMPGFSASPFVKAVTNHPDRPLLIGFAADKISDALDQRKGLKIIPLKRLFDLDPQPDGKDKAPAAKD